MAEQIKLVKSEFRIDDSGNPYIRLEIKVDELNKYKDKLQGKDVNVDIVVV